MPTFIVLSCFENSLYRTSKCSLIFFKPLENFKSTSLSVSNSNRFSKSRNFSYSIVAPSSSYSFAMWLSSGFCWIPRIYLETNVYSLLSPPNYSSRDFSCKVGTGMMTKLSGCWVIICLHCCRAICMDSSSLEGFTGNEWLLFWISKTFREDDLFGINRNVGVLINSILSLSESMRFSVRSTTLILTSIFFIFFVTREWHNVNSYSVSPILLISSLTDSPLRKVSNKAKALLFTCPSH